MAFDVNYRALFEYAPDNYLVLAPDPPRFTMVAANEARIRETMIRREDVIGRPLFEVFPDNPADPRATGVKNLGASLLEVIRTRKPHWMTVQKYDIRNPAGEFEERYWEPLNTPVFDEHGELIYIIHRVEDVTEQVRSGQRLRILESVVTAANDAVVVTEPEPLDAPGPRIIYVNEALTRMTGYGPEELLGKTPRVLQGPGTDPEATRRIRAALERGEPVRVELLNYRKDGSEFWVEVSIAPVLDASGQVVQWTSIQRETTARRQAEETALRLTREEAARAAAEAAEERARFLSEASRILASSLDYQETLDRVAHLAVPRIADWCAVDVLEEGAIHRLAIAHADPSMEEAAREYLRRNPPDPNATMGVARVLRTGEPELYPEIPEHALRERARSEEDLQILRGAEMRSAMIVPMVARGQILGAITFVTAESGRRFGPSDLGFAQELAGRAAVAVDNARLYQSAEEARRGAEQWAREEAVLRGLARALAAAIGVDRVAALVTEAAIELMPGFGAYVERIESPEGEVEVIAAGGSGTPRVGTRVPYPGSLTEEIIDAGTPHLLTEVGAIGESIAPYLVESCRQCSGLVVPLISAGEPLGALVLLRGAEQDNFQQEEIARADTLGDLASVSFRRALLVEAEREARGEAERRPREERALREAAEAVTATFTVEEVISQIARSALAATNADGAVVERVDIARGEMEITAVAGERMPAPGGRQKYSGSLAEQVIERKVSVRIPVLAEARDRISSDLLQACPECSALAVPLLNAGEAIGALILLREPGKWTFRPDEIERAHTFAHLAALAFRKVHLLEDSERKREELARVMASRARLIRGFSHDVKNPLGAADGFLQLMEEGILDHLTPKQEASVGKARSSLHAALRLIDDLLELARAETGAIRMEWAPVDIEDAAREIAGQYRAQAEGKGLSFRFEVPAQVPVIHSDADRARQILGNLVSNAVKYTETGGVTVRLAVREGAGAPGPGRWVAVDVIDTGPGISAEEQEFLFKEFSRLETAGEAKGVGIGLAISQAIAHALGGGITVESEVGKGSTFTLWLPVEREE